MNQFLQIMNEDTKNSHSDVDNVCFFVVFYVVVGGVFYIILLHVILFL